jgi:HEAT repeat protein
MRPASITVLILAGFVSLATAGSADLDAEFARILKLEDQRSMGDGALADCLDASRPLELRVRAVLAIGRIGTPVATPYDLLSAVKDPAPELRRMAAFALGEIDDIKAAPLLASMLDDPDPQARALAAEALGKLKDPASLASLTRLLSDPASEVIGMTLRALWKIDAGDRLPDLSARAAGIYLGGFGDLKRDAAYFMMRAQMGRPDEESIEPALIVVAKDEDPLARSYAARGLGARKSPASTEALLALAADPDWRVRVNAFNGLKARPVAGTGDAGPRWNAYEAGVNDKDTGVALAALAALESFDAPQARERLVGALAHSKARFREVAALALAAREKEAALPSLRPLIEDPAWSVRARVAEALGTIGAAQVEADVRRLAADADPRVRSVAIEAAGKIKSAGAAALVTRSLDDVDPYVRATAIEALGGGVAPVPDDLPLRLGSAYRRGLDDTPNDARLAALAALAKIPGDAARAQIEKALEDRDYLVRRRAAELLRDSFKLDRFARVAAPAPSRTDEEYLEAVRRARRQVTATFETDAGTIVVELLPADAPLTVDNFIRLARQGKLDGLVYHRVVPNFVIQDGDPRGDGNGGPPWQIRCEINLRRYGEGAVGMALSGKDTGASQYFITHSPQPHLDGGYTVFGQVVCGQSVVDRMAQGDAIHRVRITESSMGGPPVRNSPHEVEVGPQGSEYLVGERI